MDAVPDYGAVATRLMAKMGFEAGMGLGPSGGGIREPIAVDAGQRKAGLGYAKPKRRRRRKGKRSRWGDLIKGVRLLLSQRVANEASGSLEPPGNTPSPPQTNSMEHCN